MLLYFTWMHPNVVNILTRFLRLLFSEVLDLMLASKYLTQLIHCLYLFFIIFLSTITPFIFNIINISLHSGIDPSSLKHDKTYYKPRLDIECLSNYIPIYQLHFISKILEIIVSKQLINYPNVNLLFDTRQN